MARINFNEIDNFNKTSTSHWFSLKDDGDSALIQFPFNSLQDIEYQNVHNCKAVSQTGNTYDAMVACLRSRFDDPLDTCPLCSSGDIAKVPYLIPVIDYTTGEAKIWKRNKSFMDELNYNIQNTPNFRNTVFKAVRIGKKGDKKTSYKLYPQPQMQPKDFFGVQKLELVGTVIKGLDYQEMIQYLQTGVLPNKDKKDDPIPFSQPAAQPSRQNIPHPMSAPIQAPNSQVVQPAPAQNNYGSTANVHW